MNHIAAISTITSSEQAQWSVRVDLAAAQVVHVGNALRGLIRVEISGLP